MLTLSPDIESLLPAVTLHRRALHRIPELSRKEFLTQEYIAEELDRLKIKYKKIDTGIVCDLQGRSGKRLTALRADMDALAIREESAAEYRSVHEGVSHACGHDGHMAVLLTAAGYFKENKPAFDLRLIFQPAEEGASGAERLIEKGVLKGVGAIYGLHLSPSLPVGEIGLSAGAVMAGAAEFDIEFTGVSAHCAEKEKGADALFAGALFITGAQKIAEAYGGDNLFHVGKASGGSVRNAVAPDMKLLCTLRFFKEEAREEIMMKFAELLAGIKKETGSGYRVAVNAVYPPLNNDTDAVEFVKSRVSGITEVAPSFTAEDFAEYLLRVPGCFAWLGAYSGSGEPKKLHNGSFDFDEKALLYGLEYYKLLLGA